MTVLAAVALELARVAGARRRCDDATVLYAVRRSGSCPG